MSYDTYGSFIDGYDGLLLLSGLVGYLRRR